jgi:hypothetical protein
MSEMLERRNRILSVLKLYGFERMCDPDDDNAGDVAIDGFIGYDPLVDAADSLIHSWMEGITENALTEWRRLRAARLEDQAAAIATMHASLAPEIRTQLRALAPQLARAVFLGLADIDGVDLSPIEAVLAGMFADELQPVGPQSEDATQATLAMTESERVTDSCAVKEIIDVLREAVDRAVQLRTGMLPTMPEGEEAIQSLFALLKKVTEVLSRPSRYNPSAPVALNIIKGAAAEGNPWAGQILAALDMRKVMAVAEVELTRAEPAAGG